MRSAVRISILLLVLSAGPAHQAFAGSVYTWAGVSAGNRGWDTITSNWLNSSSALVPWPNDGSNTAVFGPGQVETVNANSNDHVNAIQFTADGYIVDLNGGFLSL